MQNLTVKNFIYAILSVISISLLIAFAPVKEYQLKTAVPVNGRYMTADHLLSSYVINNENQALKYDKEGKLIGRYSENRYGQLTSVDATSPFNTLMFFKEFATVVAVDNQLNPRTLYRLPSLGINDVSAVALSDDNYIWFYDNQEAKLKKINTQYEIIQESLPVNQLLGMEIEPNFILENDRKVFVNDPNLGVLVFDVFGNYYNSFPIIGLKSFQILNKHLVYEQDGEMQLFRFTDFEVRSLPLPETIKNVDYFRLEKDMLFVLNKEELQLYEAK